MDRCFFKSDNVCAALMASALLEAAEAPPDPAEGAWFIEACAVFTLTCTLTRSIGPGTKIIIFVLVLSQQMSIKMF